VLTFCQRECPMERGVFSLRMNKNPKKIG